MSHERFAEINRGFGGVFGIQLPLLEDRNGTISRLYGVDKAGAGHSYRAYFIVDPVQVIMMTMLMLQNMMMVLMTVLVMMMMTIEQVVQARVVGDLPVALGIIEMVRQVKRFCTD